MHDWESDYLDPTTKMDVMMHQHHAHVIKWVPAVNGINRINSKKQFLLFKDKSGPYNETINTVHQLFF